MDLRFTDAENAFREEVRAFIRTALPEGLRAKVRAGRRISRDEIVAWQKLLNQQGYAVPHWPVEHGGRDWTPVQRYILREEMDCAPAPPLIALGINLVAPVIIAFGNEAQKARFLPPIANSDEWWAQGFSEPGAGSDLASLRTSARRDGDHYVVNGEKTWTSHAQYADWIFCLVRTDPVVAKQRGISFLLIDMRSPGVTLRPLATIDDAPPGRQEVNQVFFDNVRVPVANLVGEENRGWDYAKYLLSNERTGSARVGISKERLRNLKRLAAVDGKRPLLADAAFRVRVLALEVELQAHEMTTLRVLADEHLRGGNTANPLSSMLKMRGTQIQQAVSELYLEFAGPNGMRIPGDEALAEPSPDVEAGADALQMMATNYFNWRKLSIFGGSNEIQHNILARSVLGL
ncbi:MAG: acyl-CoA dehydrogenase family protein [Pseudomonadota bacterium]